MIRQEDRGGIRLLFLDRPEKRNAIDTALATALIAALQVASDDAAVTAVVLSGDGAGFSAGADLAEIRTLAAVPEARAARAALSAALLAAPGAVGKPVIAALHGAAMGAGAALALSCDQVVMASGARLGFPEARHGMVPERMVPVLRRHLPPRRCFDLLASGRDVPPDEALQWGLADEVVAADALLDAACRRAAAMALLPPAGLAALKRLCGLTTEVAA